MIIYKYYFILIINNKNLSKNNITELIFNKKNLNKYIWLKNINNIIYKLIIKNSYF